MKRGLLLCCLILASAFSPVFADNLVSVVRDGSTVGSYETFSAGLSAAQAGDTILFLDD